MALFSAASSSSTSSSESARSVRIFCYGDSLTAGTSSSLWELFPYAPHLEEALNKIEALKTPENSSSNKKKASYVVRHLGMPGWTAQAMVEAADDPQYGLRAAIRGIRNPSLSCVIILAGTNDLGYQTEPDPILAPIKALHEIAWKEGVPRTVAIGVPPSGYQARVADASFLAVAANQELEAFCDASGGKATFIPFPFNYETTGENWSPDGLHLSSKGYRVLGNSLATPVLEMLNEEDLG